jgi:hypothetical protein
MAQLNIHYAKSLIRASKEAAQLVVKLTGRVGVSSLVHSTERGWLFVTAK